MSDPTDAEIDADLCCYGFDPTDRYPEYSHNQLREAYRAGFSAGTYTPKAVWCGCCGNEVQDATDLFSWCTRCKPRVADRPERAAWDQTFFAQYGVDCPFQVGKEEGTDG